MTKQSLPMFGAAILLTGGVTLLGACSSGSGNSSSSGGNSPATHTASPATSVSVSAATCKHAASLRTSLDSLTHVQLNASASGQIRKDLTNIQTQLHAIKASGSGQLSGQLNSLSSSLNQLEKAAKNMSNPPTSSQIEAIISSLGGMKAESQNTVSALKSACPHS